MTAPSSAPRPFDRRSPRASGTTLAAFLVGLPLAVAVLWTIQFGPWQHSQVIRYVSHPVEHAEVVLFCCALGALAAKLWAWRTETRACRTDVLPPWDGQPVPVAEAAGLMAGVNRLSYRLRNTYLVKRVVAVLNYLASRRSAADLDDQLRALADNDAANQENSYSLIRFITWAIPILGFLGTVLGITDAVAGVTPDTLEQSLNQVTDGLATAFDTTALALALTMVVMFLTFVTDRAEQSVLESVEDYVDRHLAHRFERPAAEGGPAAEIVAQHTQAILKATEQLVQRQADVWARSLDEILRRQAEQEKQQQDRLTAALEAALEKTLQSHAQRLAALEKQTLGQGGKLLEHLAIVAKEMSGQQAVMGRMAEALTRLQDGEKQLRRLQELLNQNLAALASAETFEEALHTLTAAVHLLTTRSNTTGLKGGSVARPGAAA